MAIFRLQQNNKAKTIITSLFFPLFAVAILLIFFHLSVGVGQSLAAEADVAASAISNSASTLPAPIAASTQETGTTTLPTQEFMNLPIMFANAVVGTFQDDPNQGTTTLPTVEYFMFMPILEQQ